MLMILTCQLFSFLFPVSIRKTGKESTSKFHQNLLIYGSKVLGKGAKKLVFNRTVLNKPGGGGSWSPKLFVFLLCHAMKHMILSLKMKGDVVSHHFLMLWFQKDFLDTVGFRTFRTFRGGPR